MDGYSVNEAAAVLGIPEGRVWELLARGVLSGSTEVGGDMRVFLRGTALPEPAPHQPNGNGGNGGSAELTPFRELLTEFRNLTERYGQALLALGEARGEVASLRGRVDLLEARLDSRSPWASAGSTTWTDAPERPDAFAPEPGALEPEPAVAEPEPAAPEPVPEPDAAPTAVGPEEPTAAIAPKDASRAESELSAEPEAVGVASADVLTDVLDATIGPPVAVASVEEEQVEEHLVEPTDIPVEAFDEPIDSEASSDAPSIEELTAVADSGPSDEAPTPRSRPTPRGPAREAFSGFAAALARAQDPTTEAVAAEFEELPGSRDAAEAMAAYRRDVEAEASAEASAEVLEAALPGSAEATVIEPTAEPAADAVSEPVTESVIESVVELAAEPAPESPTETVAEETAELPADAPSVSLQPGYSIETPEPDWIAEEDLLISAGDDPSVRADALLRLAVVSRAAVAPVIAEPPGPPDDETSEAAAEMTDDTEVEPPSVVEAEEEPETWGAVGPEPTLAAERWPEPIVEPEPTLATEPWHEPIVEPEATLTAEPTVEPEPPPTPDVASDQGMADEAPPQPEPWPEEPDLEPEPAPAESRLTPIEIAAEPPAEDDAALLAGPPHIEEPPVEEPPVEEPPFDEPPILPQEPAFWESGAGTRAPFAIAQPEPWQPAVPEPVSIEVQAAGGPSASAQAESRRPALEPEPSLEPKPLSPAAMAGRAAAARRQPRGPAARALRRLRYLLD